MLDACAPGYTIEEKEHHYWVRRGTKAFRSLPLGKRGSGSGARIELGFVRKMARQLDLDPSCVGRHLPILGLKISSPN